MQSNGGMMPSYGLSAEYFICFFCKQCYAHACRSFWALGTGKVLAAAYSMFSMLHPGPGPHGAWDKEVYSEELECFLGALPAQKVG
jgi:hypothetical protein